MNRRYKIHTIDSSINISCPISDNKKQNDLNQEESKEVVPKSIVEQKPICHSRDEFWKKYPPNNPACSREGWIENLSNTGDDNTNELIKLHPDVWAVRPRLDIIYQNLEWQKW